MGWKVHGISFYLALQALFILHLIHPADATLGVIYGTQGSNVPIPSSVVQLLKTNGVQHIRIYDTNQDVLKAFAGSEIQVIIGIPNSQLAEVGRTNATAAKWLADNVVPYAGSVNITAIAVGSEVLTSFGSFSTSLVRTMMWIHDALIANGLDSQIRVSTPHSTDILATTFPPSQATFNRTLVPVLMPMLQFLSLTGSYLMLNVYPYYTYQSNFQAVDLQYALFQPATQVADTYANLMYPSLFDALVDAGYYAMQALNFSTVDIVVTETGWPHTGDANEVGASTVNAAQYNGNLAKRTNNKTGTPFKPQTPLVVYIYELFNEDLRTGATSERNYGIFGNDMNPIYNVDLTGQGRILAGNSTQYQTWCVAKKEVSQQGLQQALDWTCGQGGVNCSVISKGGACFLPDTLDSHASWAFNAYYQKNGNGPNTCDFRGVGQIVSYNPSYSSCIYQASNVTTTVGGSVPGSPASPRVEFKSSVTFGCLLLIFLVNLRYFL
ncbi:hypothetical protein AXG93_3426s1140 [Marchantia polymorpha subsp. ruderalis]|uniref:glucan endo-1,3-beta-D-glucosidase n=1 Tax=Marchantia polymorpha subsp. ruderalis TaxID=1480154 RepID=A0A176VDM6_MARPO|nr:hypothetical protein AXG93_3426s1140 [Marchantia polymorpha subsp. ruderalis]